MSQPRHEQVAEQNLQPLPLGTTSEVSLPVPRSYPEGTYGIWNKHPLVVGNGGGYPPNPGLRLVTNENMRRGCRNRLVSPGPSLVPLALHHQGFQGYRVAWQNMLGVESLAELQGGAVSQDPVQVGVQWLLRRQQHQNVGVDPDDYGNGHGNGNGYSIRHAGGGNMQYALNCFAPRASLDVPNVAHGRYPSAGKMGFVGGFRPMVDYWPNSGEHIKPRSSMSHEVHPVNGSHTQVGGLQVESKPPDSLQSKSITDGLNCVEKSLSAPVEFDTATVSESARPSAANHIVESPPAPIASSFMPSADHTSKKQAIMGSDTKQAKVKKKTGTVESAFRRSGKTKSGSKLKAVAKPEGPDRVEDCLGGNVLVTVPASLFKLPNLRAILNLKTWHESIEDGEREFLKQFLPKGMNEDPGGGLDKLLGGEENFHFGNPLASAWEQLVDGEYHPRAVKFREGLKCLHHAEHFHFVREYHNRMVAELVEMAEAVNNHEGSLAEKIDMLNEQASRFRCSESMTRERLSGRGSRKRSHSCSNSDHV